eukprot:7666079-Alexandrium_andersonii.AAC.1
MIIRRLAELHERQAAKGVRVRHCSCLLGIVDQKGPSLELQSLVGSELSFTPPARSCPHRDPWEKG